ncbi:hypothetical protein Pcinc_005117 [Petrolisthes cinctipes]|uniref:Uncharacterized protein n=1 Tax=Petrolisthes cinctipes TaxID=88211 RepID=A0AAE1L324_PETCI|nr:hypothetical protein Pcinc_005117 [Petrolisthes cinctipes]
MQEEMEGMQMGMFELCEETVREKENLKLMREQIQKLEEVPDELANGNDNNTNVCDEVNDPNHSEMDDTDLTDGRTLLTSLKKRLPPSLREKKLYTKSGRERKPLTSLRKRTAHLLKVKPL